MGTGISDLELSKISELIAERIGLHFPRSRWHDLERGIHSVACEFGFKDSESCIHWLTSSHLTRNQIEILASHLTVGETYFFREKKSFDIIERHILSELIRSRRDTEKRLRIWSAGCATGEEPYSIAILLNKMISNVKDWNIIILATDINPRFLQKASAGVYNEWSFRETPQWIKERYFKKTKEGRFEVLNSIKKMVTFSYQNLVEDSYPSLLNNTNAMDIIFCRNVLMYFDHECQSRVIQNLYRCLVDGGWLIVSPSETSHVLFSQFVIVNSPGAILHRKAVVGDKIQVSGFEMQDASFKMQEIIPSSIDFATFPEPEIICPEEPIPLEAGVPKAEEIYVDPYEEALGLYEQGQYREAVEKLLTIIFGGRENPKVMALLTRSYANQGKLSEAFDWCERTVAIDKMNPGCHYLMATILQEQGRIEDAVASLKRSLYLAQDFVLAHFALGNLARHRGKNKEAKKYFDNAVALLNVYRQEDILPESEGVTAGRLKEIVRLMTVD